MGVSTNERKVYFMSKQTHDNKHLTLNERKIIQTGIENRSNKIDIARTIGKDPTTVAKEIRKHRTFKARNQFFYPSICIHRQECGGCKNRCSRYEEIKCNKRDKSPGGAINVLKLLHVIWINTFIMQHRLMKNTRMI